MFMVQKVERKLVQRILIFAVLVHKTKMIQKIRLSSL